MLAILIHKSMFESKIAGAKSSAEQIIEDAKREADALKKKPYWKQKMKFIRLRSDAEREIRERRNELQKQENRLLQKEENLDRKDESLDKRETLLEKKEDSLNRKTTAY